MFFWLTTVAFSLVFLTTNISLSAQDRRIALVIGNGSYKSSPLKNPVNDATDIANALRNLGFSVILKTNANQRTMEEAIRDFGKKLRLGGVGLFYFAGHGLQIDGRNYLIPINANIETESDVRYEAVDAGRVLGKMEDAGNNLNLVILDACRDNPFARSFRTSIKGLARMDAPKGSLIAYATAPGSVAADGYGRNGIYTKYLLEYISNPNLKVEEILKQVRVDVINETNDKQIPWESSSLTGEFYFASKRGIVVAQNLKAKSKYSSELEKEGEKLKRERQELERLKMEIERTKLEAERKRLEAEKKKLLTEETKYASISKYDTGVVYDKKTGLEWVAGPEKNTKWYDAKKWVENLNVAGGGWRMPTRAELKSLYKKGAGSRNMTALLKTNGWYVWSGETEGSSSAWFFGFDDEGWSDRGYSSYGTRSFAVRSRR